MPFVGARDQGTQRRVRSMALSRERVNNAIHQGESAVRSQVLLRARVSTRQSSQTRIHFRMQVIRFGDGTKRDSMRAAVVQWRIAGRRATPRDLSDVVE